MTNCVTSLYTVLSSLQNSIHFVLGSKSFKTLKDICQQKQINFTIFRKTTSTNHSPTFYLNNTNDTSQSITYEQQYINICDATTIIKVKNE